ncbi:hypothetical protein [Arthrobacter sp. MAHUQ-56]
MKAPEKTSDHPRPVPTRGPVFVDASGRRLRRVQLLGLGVLGLVAAYVVLVLAAFIGGSGVSAPFLPVPAAAGAHDLPTAPPVSPEPGPRPADGLPGPAVPAVIGSPAAVAVDAPAAPPVDSAAAAPTAPAAPVAAPVATAVPAEPGMSGTAPGSSGTAQGGKDTAPGQTTRPTAPAHQ